MKSSGFLICFFFASLIRGGGERGGVTPAPGSGSPLPPGAGDVSRCPLVVWSKYLPTDPLDCSGDFPFLLDSPMPPGILVSIGVDILCIVKD